MNICDVLGVFYLRNWKYSFQYQANQSFHVLYMFPTWSITKTFLFYSVSFLRVSWECLRKTEKRNTVRIYSKKSFSAVGLLFKLVDWVHKKPEIWKHSLDNKYNWSINLFQNTLTGIDLSKAKYFLSQSNISCNFSLSKQPAIFFQSVLNRSQVYSRLENIAVSFCLNWCYQSQKCI